LNYIEGDIKHKIKKSKGRVLSK